MRVLFVTETLPLPLDTGGKIRTFYILREAARRHRVTLVTHGSREDAARLREKIPLEQLILAGSGGRSAVARAFGAARTLVDRDPYLVATMHESATMRSEIARRCASSGFDLVHFDHLDAALYRDVIGRTPYVLDEHNAEARLLHRAASNASNPILRTYLEVQATRVTRYEAEACRAAAVTTAVSDEDASQLNALAPRARVRVVPNGVDVTALSSRRRDPVSGTMVFVGSMDWFANVDAVSWFVDEILPKVRESVPGARLFIVGRKPTAEVRRLANVPGVEVTGGVPDVGEFYARAQVSIVPLRVGGGTRLKILESFAAGAPVVSTRIGAEGIAARADVHACLADDANSFADAVVRVMRDDEFSARLATSALELVRNTYDWSAVGEQLDDAYDAVFERAGARDALAAEPPVAQVFRGEIRVGGARGRRRGVAPDATMPSPADGNSVRRTE